MNAASRAALGVAALGLALHSGCASSGASAVAPCVGFSPPRVLALAAVKLPADWVSMRLGADVTDEVVIGRDGAIRDVRLVTTVVPPLAPFAEASLRRGRFSAGSLEGNPVAVRAAITLPVGRVRPGIPLPPYDTLRAFVTGGQSREARWQLAGSLDRLTLVAHVGSAIPQGAAIVAVAPGGGEKVLLPIRAAAPPLEIHDPAGTGRFLADAGDYRLELRAGATVLATTIVTVAPSFEEAIVNACEPLVAP